MTNEPVLSLGDAHRHYKQPDGSDLNVLRGVSLSLAPGESVSIVGKSGSGKSTLLKCLGLFQPLSSGTYEIMGSHVGDLSDRRASKVRAAHIGFVFQDFRLLSNLNAVRNVEYACALAGLPRATWKNTAQEALSAVGLASRMNARVTQLSGGERQRVAIARALAKSPQIVLADEPTGALDADTSTQVMDILHREVRGSGVSLIIVTHDNLVASSCDRHLLLERGELTPVEKSKG